MIEFEMPEPKGPEVTSDCDKETLNPPGYQNSLDPNYVGSLRLHESIMTVYTPLGDESSERFLLSTNVPWVQKVATGVIYKRQYLLLYLTVTLLTLVLVIYDFSTNLTQSLSYRPWYLLRCILFGREVI